MTLLPLLTQLDNGTATAGDDCSVMTGLNAIRWASDGRVGPRSHAEVKDWVHDFRRWAGKPTGGLLFRTHTLKAYQSRELAQRFVREGLSPIKVEYTDGIGWGTLGRRIGWGQFCHLAVSYSTLRKGSAPVGSATFDGGHSLALVDTWKNKHGHLWVHDGDPLFDDRRPGIPDGWTGARLLDFRAAAGAWGARPPGPGRATAIFVRKSV